MDYCGLDLGRSSSRYCIVDKDRTILREANVATTEAALRRVFDRKRKLAAIALVPLRRWTARYSPRTTSARTGRKNASDVTRRVGSLKASEGIRLPSTAPSKFVALVDAAQDELPKASMMRWPRCCVSSVLCLQRSRSAPNRSLPTQVRTQRCCGSRRFPESDLLQQAPTQLPSLTRTGSSLDATSVPIWASCHASTNPGLPCAGAASRNAATARHAGRLRWPQTPCFLRSGPCRSPSGRATFKDVWVARKHAWPLLANSPQSCGRSESRNATTTRIWPPKISCATRRDGHFVSNPSTRMSATPSPTQRRRTLGSTVHSANLMCRGLEGPTSEHVSTSESRFVSTVLNAVAKCRQLVPPRRPHDAGRDPFVLDGHRSIEGGGYSPTRSPKVTKKKRNAARKDRRAAQDAAASPKARK